MDNIRKAIDRASSTEPDEQKLAPQFRQPWTGPGDLDHAKRADPAHLERHRIIAHDDTDGRSKHFHILRTQILQTMDSCGWQTLAVASPTPGCQATETAINLAISIARQPDRSVLLVDFDLSTSSVASSLGLSCNAGVASVLLRAKPLADALIPVSVSNYRMMVLPNDAPVPNSSEWLASRAMTSLLQELKAAFRSSILVVNLAPILPSDDAISILPQLDCALFVAAAGKTRRSEVRACERYLKTVEILRVVVNGAPSVA